jgi:SAM-dependent methyltransferase
MNRKSVFILILGGVFMVGSTSAAAMDNSHLISHKATASSEQLISEARARIDAYQGTELSKADMHQMLNQLLDHPVGRSVFMGKGLDGQATQFFISGAPSDTNPIIRWMCEKAPVVLATQERFRIFRNELQKRLQSGMHFASIPCGLMDDLLGLDLTGTHDVLFSGIDLDQNSLKLALASAKAKGLEEMTHFHQSDAWDLGKFEGQFDVLTSNGLNIYEGDDAKVTALYREFFKALKHGGVLITSFLTPPPAKGGTTWKDVNPTEATKQRILFGVIIGVGWQHFRTEETTRAQLKEAGFADVEVIYDSQGMFPTVIARKA